MSAADMIDASMSSDVAVQVFNAAISFVDADREVAAADEQWDDLEIFLSTQRAKAAGYAWKQAKAALVDAVGKARTGGG